MSDPTKLCGGVGVCLTGSGSCQCFAGYAGDACEKCDNKYHTYFNGSGPCIKVSPPCRVIAGDAEDGAATALAVGVVAVVAAAAGSGCARQVPEPSCFDGAKNANEFGQDCGLKAGCSPCDFELIELAQVRFVSTGVPIEAAGVLPATRGTSAVLGYSSIAPVMYLCACV